LICKEEPEEIAFSGRHCAEISIHLTGRLIPGDDMPTRTDNIGRIDPHRLKNELERRINSILCGKWGGRKLLASQNKEMCSLIGVEL
jgi:hypothetical protein